VLLDSSRALPLLATLFGPDAADLLPRLESLAQRHRALLRRMADPGPWTQADVFLITYPDQVLSPGQPPLQVLSEFCHVHMKQSIGGLHLLPFFPSSSDDGFAVMDHRLVDPKLGSWRDIHNLVDDFQLMVDLVLNHASAQGAWFQAFGQGSSPYESFFLVPDLDADWSKVVRPRASPLFTPFESHAGSLQVWTTFGPDQVDFDYRRPEVLLEMLDVLLDYVAHGAKAIRLDAVAYVTKQAGTTCIHLPQTHALVKLFRLVLRAAAPWVRLITETNVPHADNVAYFGEGDEANLVYQFALPPLVLHTLTTGDAGPLSKWAAVLEPPAGEATFFNFLASHDGIGLNGAHGFLSADQTRLLVERAEHCGAVSYRSDPQAGLRPYELNVNLLDFLADSPPESPLPKEAVPRFLTAHAILLALAGVPAVYFHSLVGSRGDAAGVQRTGLLRSINRQKLERAGLEADLARHGNLRQTIFDGLGRLLRARRALPALHPKARQDVLRGLPDNVFGLERTSIDRVQRLLCLHEVAGRAITLNVHRNRQRGRDAVNGGTLSLAEISLGPYQTRWIEVVP